MVTGLSTMIVFTFGYGEYHIDVPLFWYALGGYVYIQGAVLYVLRVPERCKPGRFDLCGASHQLFHLAVLMGCGIHFWQNCLLFKERETFECPVTINV